MPSPNTKLAALSKRTPSTSLSPPQASNRGTPHMSNRATPQMSNRGTPQISNRATPQMSNRGGPQMSHRSTNSRQAAKEYEAKRKGRDTLLLEANVSEKKAANECNDEEIYVAAQKLMLRELCDPTSTQCGFVQKDQQVAIRKWEDAPTKPPTKRAQVARPNVVKAIGWVNAEGKDGAPTLKLVHEEAAAPAAPAPAAAVEVSDVHAEDRLEETTASVPSTNAPMRDAKLPVSA